MREISLHLRLFDMNVFAKSAVLWGGVFILPRSPAFPGSASPQRPRPENG